jgi:predicted phage terminase large subunit-like protein
VPGYNALILRKTFKDLAKPDALIPLSFQVLAGTEAEWNNQRHEWSFPSGATLSFGYCDAENDKYIYQGAQYQFVGFDELTQFSETQYLYVNSRVRRRANVDVLLRARGASNPGGLGHEWVKQRFITEENPDRPFIPAKLEDNPDLDKESYIKSLDLLDLVTRAQLRHGDWRIRPEGNLFKRFWFKDILDKEPNDVVRWRRHWDLAATEPKPGKDPDWVSGCKLGLRMNGTYVIADMRRARMTPSKVEELVKSTAHIDGKSVEIGIEEEGGASGKLVVDYYQRVVLLGHAVYGERPSGDKVTRAQPLSAAVEQGRVALVRGSWINEYLDELCAFPVVDHDDQVDATTGAFNAISAARAPGQTMHVPGGHGRVVR